VSLGSAWGSVDIASQSIISQFVVEHRGERVWRCTPYAAPESTSYRADVLLCRRPLGRQESLGGAFARPRQVTSLHTRAPASNVAPG